MSFTKEDRDKILTSLAVIEANVCYIKPKVEANTKFRYITLGIALFVSFTVPLLIGFFVK